MEKSAEAMLKEHYGEGKTNLSYILALNREAGKKRYSPTQMQEIMKKESRN